MNPELYHGTYETDADWPGRWHFHNGASAYCGKRVHETHNHDFWNTNLGKQFSTDTYPDLCLAFR